MQVKHKSKYIVLTALFCTLIITATLSLPVNLSETKSENPTTIKNIIEPKTSVNVDKVEFIQEGGHSFIYNSVNSSGNFLKTGDGAFIVKIYSDATPSQQFQLEVQGLDKHYKTYLAMDLAIIEDPSLQDEFFPYVLVDIMGLTEGGFWYNLAMIGVQAIINLLGIEMDAETDSLYDVLKFYGLNILRIVLEPSSVNTADTTYYSTYNATEGCHEIIIPNRDYYYFDPRIYLGYDLDITNLLDAVPLIPLDVEKREYIQDIKFGLTNNFNLSLYNGGVVGGGINGQTRMPMIVRNDDISAPVIEVQPQWSQENPTTNWQVKVKVADEVYGSGLNNESVHLFYSVNQGTWKEANKMLLYDDGYLYTEIPNQLAGSEIRFYIQYEDMKGNSFTSKIYTYYANPLEIAPIAILLIGIAIATVATVVVTRIYRNRHQPRVITLPKKKSVDKYYKKVRKEEGGLI